MAETQDGRNDLYYNWEAGDADWGDKVSENFLNIGLKMYMSVINQTTTIPPAATAGDAYIVAAGATGDWSGQDGNIAVWARPVGTGTPALQWVFIIPYGGFLAFDESNNTLYAHNGTNWSTNGFTFTFI